MNHATTTPTNPKPPTITDTPPLDVLLSVLKELSDARVEVTDLLLLAWDLDEAPTSESAVAHAICALRSLRGAEQDIEEHMAGGDRAVQS